VWERTKRPDPRTPTAIRAEVKIMVTLYFRKENHHEKPIRLLDFFPLMPRCILESSMVSLNTLHDLHGPAGQGERSGDAKTQPGLKYSPFHAGAWVCMHQGQVKPAAALAEPTSRTGR